MLESVSISDEMSPAGPSIHRPAPSISGCERRERLRQQLQQTPLAGISPEEIDVHFSAMPAHYWERVNEADVLWGLETIHGFLKLVATPSIPPTKPFVDWRPGPEADRTRVLFCTWDRHGLLAKAAAAFSAVRLNILQADVFTRADNVVLDLFYVNHSDGHGAATKTQLQEMTFLLEGALTEPPRFASLWACSRHKFLVSSPAAPPRIRFDNDSSAVSTVVHVESGDRLGLLYDILQTMADHGLNIRQACIGTDRDIAHDSIDVTNAQGEKLLDPAELEKLRGSLEAAITVTG
jgi:[protein-PII] uridylyltransferase